MNTKSILLIDIILKHNDGLSLSQVVCLSNLPQTTVHRTLNNLVRDNVLSKIKDHYTLGSVMLRWLNSDIGNNRYVDLIHPYLILLAEKTKETVHLVQRENNIGFYIDKVQGVGPITLQSKIGSKLNLYSTGAGRAILMLFSEKERFHYLSTEELIKNTKHTITNTTLLEDNIIQFQNQGYATEIEQNENHIQCLGVPFRLGDLYLAISITTTLLTDQKKFEGMAQTILQTVDTMKKELKI